VDVDGTVEGFKVAVRGIEDELLAAFDASGGAGQGQEEIVFNGSESERCTVERGSACRGIDVEFGNGYRSGMGGLVKSRGEAGTAQDGAQAGQQFAGGKRLGEVVISADF